jgi:hypothetical protein
MESVKESWINGFTHPKKNAYQLSTRNLMKLNNFCTIGACILFPLGIAHSQTFSFNFSDSNQLWTVGFADYDSTLETTYGLEHEYRTLYTHQSGPVHHREQPQ